MESVRILEHRPVSPLGWVAARAQLAIVLVPSAVDAACHHPVLDFGAPSHITTRLDCALHPQMGRRFRTVRRDATKTALLSRITSPYNSCVGPTNSSTALSGLTAYSRAGVVTLVVKGFLSSVPHSISR